MSLSLVGLKCGMTSFFDSSGNAISTTVIKILSNRILNVKSFNTDGYYAVQVSVGNCNKKKLNKSLIGIYDKAKIDYGNFIFEFRIDESGFNNFNIGSDLNSSLLKDVLFVNVSGISKGKGFAGVIKRHNFKSQRYSHGTSLTHRAPGSIGQCQDPGRVVKGKKMPGHMGNDNVTIKNLKVLKVYTDKNIILLKGAVPGNNGSNLILTTINK